MERRRRRSKSTPSRQQVIQELAYSALGRCVGKTLHEIYDDVVAEYGRVGKNVVRAALDALARDGVVRVLVEEDDNLRIGRPPRKRKDGTFCNPKTITKFLRGNRPLALYSYVTDDGEDDAEV